MDEGSDEEYHYLVLWTGCKKKEKRSTSNVAEAETKIDGEKSYALWKGKWLPAILAVKDSEYNFILFLIFFFFIYLLTFF